MSHDLDSCSEYFPKLGYQEMHSKKKTKLKQEQNKDIKQIKRDFVDRTEGLLLVAAGFQSGQKNM